MISRFFFTDSNTDKNTDTNTVISCLLEVCSHPCSNIFISKHLTLANVRRYLLWTLSVKMKKDM